jgi:WD40 repeat protein
MSDVFISYSRKDIAFARLLQESLQQSQIDTWIDWERIPVGEKWWPEICAAIENANVFMFIISNNSIDSPVCKDEINHALKNNKRIIPIIVDNLNREVIKEFAPGLPQFNWIIIEKDQLFRIEENPQVSSDKPEDNQVAEPLPAFEEALGRLGKAIHTDWEWAKYHTRLQVNALLWDGNRRNPSYLVRGKALEESEQQLLRATGKDPRPTDLQVEYVTASRKDETLHQEETLKLEQKARLRQRAVIWTVGIGLVVAIVLGGVALGQRNTAVAQGNLRATAESNAVSESHTRATAEANAIDQRDLAIARQLAAEARSLTSGHLDEALLLAIEANRRLDLSDTRSSLLYAVKAQPELMHYLPEHGWGWGSLAYSPDGKILAIGTVDHSVLLLDARSGEPVAAALTGWSTEVLSVAFSPEGHSLVAGDNAGLVLRWDIGDPTHPKRMNTYQFRINSNPMMITMAPGLSELQEGYFPPSIYLWNVPASQPVNICNCGVTSLAIAPDGQSLAAGLGTGEVSLVDLLSGQEKKNLAADRRIGSSIDSIMVLDLAFSPDGSKLVLSTASGSIRIWDLIKGDAYSVPHSNLAPALSRLALSPDGKTLAYTIDEGNGVFLMDMDSRQFHKYPLQSGVKITSLAFNPDGGSLALGLNNDTIQLWDMQSHQPIGMPLNGHRGEVMLLAFNSDGHRLASLDWEHSAIMWDLQPEDRLLTTIDNSTDYVANIALSADGRYMAAVGDVLLGTNLNILDLQTTPPVSQTLDETEMGLTPVQSDISFFPKTHILVFYGFIGDTVEPEILFWDLDRKQAVLKIPSATAPLALSPDGHWLAGVNRAGGNDKSDVALWDAQTGKMVHELDSSATGVDANIALAFSPDSNLLAIGFENGGLRLWHVEDGKPDSLVLSGHLDSVTGLVFSPDGKTLASSSRDKTIRLWNVAQPSTAPVELDGHTSWVTGVTYSPDGSTLASSSLDGTIRLWDSQSNLTIGQLTGININHLFNPVFAADGSRLFAGGSRPVDSSTDNSLDALYNSGLLLQWEIGPAGWSRTACSIAYRNFSLTEWRNYFGTEPYRKTCETLPLHPSITEKFLQSEPQNLLASGLQEALYDFDKMLPLDPALNSELEASLKTFLLEDLMRYTAQQVNTGEVDPSVTLFKGLQTLGIAEHVPAQIWNQICWYGSLWGQAQKVADICELAVSQDPFNGDIRDSRGLALALTGKTNEAIQDFQAMVDWCKQNECSGTIVTQREQWIAALKSGKNPFDDQLLKSLLNQ